MLFVVTCLVPGIGLLWASFDALLYTFVGERLRDGAIPYRDFDLEYPPGALVAFVLPALAEFASYDMAFKVTQAVFGAACVACVAITLDAISATPRRILVGGSLAALAPVALGPVSLVRYDLWPTFLVAAAVAAFARDHPRVGFALVGLATAAKLYPLALLPIAMLYVDRRLGRREAWLGAAISAGVAAAVVLPFVVVAPEGIRYFVHWHLDRGLQLETVPGGALGLLDALGLYDATLAFRSGAWDFVGSAPDALATLQTLALAASVVAVTLLFARSRRTPADFCVAVAATVALTLVFAKVLSPQFLLWLVPLVPLVVSDGVLAWCVFGGALLLTHAFFPSRYEELATLEPLPVAILVARNALLVALAVLLVRRLARAR